VLIFQSGAICLLCRTQCTRECSERDLWRSAQHHSSRARHETYDRGIGVCMPVSEVGGGVNTLHDLGNKVNTGIR
jgi:hypothetical protein